MLRRLDAIAGRRLRPQPSVGATEPLTEAALVDLLPRLRRQFPLQPAYDEQFLSWLFGELELVNVGERVVGRLVRGDDGRPLGAYVMYVTPGWLAEVVQVVAAGDDVGIVLDHLLAEAAAEGAVEVRGRFEPHLLPHLRARRCRLTHADWTVLHAHDPELVAAVLAGRALLSRLDGEWWMRPRRDALL